MPQPRLILVTGLPGSGKSELARSLARDCAAALIAKDAIKEAMMDGGPLPMHVSRKLSDVAFAVMFALAKETLAAGAALMLEGNFRAGQHEPPLLAALPAQPIIIVQLLCRAPEDLRQRRLAARAADPRRHPGHHDAQQAAPVAACDGFLELPGERLLVNTGQAIAAALAECREPLLRMLHSD